MPDQWLARLKTFLDIDPSRIGVIRGGKRKPTGEIDVALIQSLSRKGEVADLVANYGHLVALFDRANDPISDPRFVVPTDPLARPVDETHGAGALPCAVGADGGDFTAPAK